MLFFVGYLVGAVLFFVLCAYLSAKRVIYQLDHFGIVGLTALWPVAVFMFALVYLGIGIGKVFDWLVTLFSETK